tara:strand:+ start:2298 stop:2651 length:354 start_codon:yes stop_codon:yes gene_type:complete
MDIETYRNYCLSLKGAEEKMPFDKTTLVFSVKDKMFSSTNIETFELINVKCEPEKALLLREKHEEVIPGYYMNKKHWNSILTNGKITSEQMEKWIKDSYDLVVSRLPKKIRNEIENE